MKPKLKSGFTLIELLIVIAIILILIAIALPNFLEAQIRAKTAKSQAEMRSLGTAIESLRAERGVLLIDFWEDHGNLNTEGSRRIREDFAGVGHWRPPCSPAHPDGRSMECVLFPLTTPVAYMTEIPQDALAPDLSSAPGTGNAGHDEWVGHPGNRTYLYADRETSPGDPHRFDFPDYPDFNAYQFPTIDAWVPGQITPLKRDEWVLAGFGPAVEDNLDGNSVRKPFIYSPTNGTKSIGLLYFRASQGVAR